MHAAVCRCAQAQEGRERRNTQADAEAQAAAGVAAAEAAAAAACASHGASTSRAAASVDAVPAELAGAADPKQKRGKKSKAAQRRAQVEGRVSTGAAETESGAAEREAGEQRATEDAASRAAEADEERSERSAQSAETERHSIQAAEREAPKAAVAGGSHGASTSGAAVLPVRPPTPLVQPGGDLRHRPPLSASSALLSHPVLGAALRSARVRSGVADPNSAASPADAAPGAASPSPPIEGNRAERPQPSPQPRPPQQPPPSGAPSAAAAEVATAAAAAAGCVLHDEDDDALCVVCLDATSSVTLLPCHHRVLCAGCLSGVRASCNEVRRHWVARELHWGHNALRLRDADACVLTSLLACSLPQCPMCRTPVEGAYVEWG
jgi:hypothetical protein